jgi:two-component system phosphate regulon sensor histidine kinase PhoR
VEAGTLISLGVVGLLAVMYVNAARGRYALSRRLADLPALRRELNALNRALIAAEKRFAAMIETVFDPVLVVDVSNVQPRVVALNAASREAFKVGPSPLGETVMNVTRQHEIDLLVSRIAAGQEIPENQLQFNERTFRVRGTLISDGDRAFVIIVLQDISELLRLTRARRDMVANFSHDLRTPISSIRLLVESLQMNLGKNPERDRKQIDKLASEADSLQHMTQELIDLSMIESGKAIMRLVPTPLADVLDKVISIMDTQIDQKRIHITRTIPPNFTVLVDPEQLKRVIANVVHNAVKFTPTEGEITLTALREGEMARLCISDSGPGIPPHERARIFERFYQVDPAQNR